MTNPPVSFERPKAQSVAITNPPISFERPTALDSLEILDELEVVDEEHEEIPELLRSFSARPPVRIPSDRPPPNVTRITPAKRHHGIVEEVVISRKDPRRED